MADYWIKDELMEKIANDIDNEMKNVAIDTIDEVLVWFKEKDGEIGVYVSGPEIDGIKYSNHITIDEILLTANKEEVKKVHQKLTNWLL